MIPELMLHDLNQSVERHWCGLLDLVENWIGRLDLVENRYDDIETRGCCETPGGRIMLIAHRAIESITLDREVLALKDDLMPRYARMIFNVYWFSPERRLLQMLIDQSQKPVN